MRLVNDNGKFTPFQAVKILIRKQELLYRTNDNTLFIVDSVRQTARTLFIVNGFHQAGRMVETVNRVLQLTIQNHTVGDNDNGIEHSVIVIIVQRRQTIRNPSNRIRLTATSRMFDKITSSRTHFFHFGNEFFNNVILMITRENKFCVFLRFRCAVHHHFFTLFYKGNEFLD